MVPSLTCGQNTGRRSSTSRRTHSAALAGRYLWHEFGDLHLLLPRECGSRLAWSSL
ncbi:MAG TPA: hypothetical protein VJ436_06155 [Anaerolineales bacterium]|nr:hypothetical protein [Anaerolineales bacterium]